MKAYGVIDVQMHIFLTSALVGGEWSASRPGRFTSEERAPGTHWVGRHRSPLPQDSEHKGLKCEVLDRIELAQYGWTFVNTVIYTATWINV
jgi:hypothetical protein